MASFFQLGEEDGVGALVVKASKFNESHLTLRRMCPCGAVSLEGQIWCRST
jgi:hypothetical protein